MTRLLLLISSVLLSVVLLELGLTAAYVGLGNHGPLEIVPRWNSPFIFRAKPGIGANAESLRRSLPVAIPKPASTFRILSYGDSIAAGYSLAESDTYSSLLEERINRGAVHDAPVEVLNMYRGHSPSIYAFHLRGDLPRYTPDAVLLQIELLNDVSDEAHVRTTGRDEDGLPLEIQSHRYILGWDGHLLAPLSFSGSFLERTKTYAKLSRWYGRTRNRLSPNPIFADDSADFYYSSLSDRYFLTRSELDAGFNRLFEAVAAIHLYLARRNVRFLLVILPSREFYTDEPYGESARRLLEKARTRAAALEIPHTVPVDAIREAGGATLFMDFCHPTARGNRVIAAELEAAIESWMIGTRPVHRIDARAEDVLPSATRSDPTFSRSLARAGTRW